MAIDNKIIILKIYMIINNIKWLFDLIVHIVKFSLPPYILILFDMDTK